MAAVWCSFDSNLCSLIFCSCSLSSYLYYPLYLFPSTNIFCLYPPHPISRYFCKESLMAPPNTLAHFKSLYCYCYPSKNFRRTISFIFHSCSFVFIRFPFVFTRVHSCSIRVHSCSIRVHSCSFVFTRVHSCSIRVPLVFTRVHSCAFVFHSCSFVFTRVHSCSFVFTRVHSCSDLCGVLDMIYISNQFCYSCS